MVEASGSAGRCGASQVDLGLAGAMLGAFGLAIISSARPLLRRRMVSLRVLPGLVGDIDFSLGLVR